MKTGKVFQKCIEISQQWVQRIIRVWRWDFVCVHIVGFTKYQPFTLTMQEYNALTGHHAQIRTGWVHLQKVADTWHLNQLWVLSCRWIRYFFGRLTCHSFRQIRTQLPCGLTDHFDSWPRVHTEGVAEQNKCCPEHQDQLLSGRTRQIRCTLDAPRHQTNQTKQNWLYDLV